MNFNVLRRLSSLFGGSSGRVTPVADIQVQSNVYLVARERGKIVGRRESHNVTVNGGRTWLRDVISALSYPEDVPGTTSPTALNTTVGAPGCNVQRASAYRPRYVAFGVGGLMQGITPPGPGTFSEVKTRYGLERPVEYCRISSDTYYLAQLLGQDLSDLDFAPNPFALRFRRIIAEADISYAAQPTYSTRVPLSEVALFSSEANGSVCVSPAESTGLVPGMLSYNTFSTLTKTPLNQIELVWEWRL